VLEYYEKSPMIDQTNLDDHELLNLRGRFVKTSLRNECLPA